MSHIGENRQLEVGHRTLLDQNLQEKFWMVELSCRELFSAAHKKFGEVLLAVSDVNEEFHGTYTQLVLRLPGVIHFYPIDSTCKTALSYRTSLFSQ